MRTDLLDKALHEMAAGGASELILAPGAARASNNGDALGLSDLPTLKRRPLETLLMHLAGTDRWARFMSAPAEGLTFIHRNVFRFAVRYEASGPAAVINTEGERP